MNSRNTMVLAGLVTALAVAVPTAAQTTLTADAGIYNAYIWRGLSLSNKPVVEPDLYLGIPVANGTLLAGAWGNVELGKYDAPDISEGGGVNSLDLTEVDLSLDYTHALGAATVTFGGVEYIYPNDFGFTTAVNTLELYGKIGLSGPFSPKLSAYYDVDEVKGLYLEGSIGHTLQVTPGFGLTLGALGGLSAGQGTDNGKVYGNFVGDGFTHADLSATTSFSVGPLTLSPTAHVIIAGDDATKITRFTSPLTSKDAKAWFGVLVTWSQAFGAQEEGK